MLCGFYKVKGNRFKEGICLCFKYFNKYPYKNLSIEKVTKILVCSILFQ